jgi:uncharacterized lipoprotein YmbA
MFDRFPKMKATGIAFLLMALTACASSAPTRFYLLNPIDGTDQARRDDVKPRSIIGIGPVTFPAYLDREEIVTRIGANELHVAGFDQWAEPLKDNFTRVLAENLSQLLPADSFILFPFSGPEKIDWQVAMEVIRLDGALGGDVLLLARWTIYEKGGTKIFMTNESRFSQPASIPEYAALAAAHTRLVEDLSREIAGTIQDLFGKKVSR